MRILLFVIAVLALIYGFGIFALAKSAVHEIEAFILFLLSAVCLSGAGIIESVNRLRKDVLAEAKQPDAHSREVEHKIR